MGVAEIEETFRAEVSRVCRNYYLQVWNEALNEARVEASFALMRAESVYYPLLSVHQALPVPRLQGGRTWEGQPGQGPSFL